VENLVVTVDLKGLKKRKVASAKDIHGQSDETDLESEKGHGLEGILSETEAEEDSSKERDGDDDDESSSSDDGDDEAVEKKRRIKMWDRLTKIKDKLKRLHSNIRWLRMVDFAADNSILEIQDVGTFQLAGFTIAVDTRSKTVDRGWRLFRRRRKQSREEYTRPAEWTITAKNLLYRIDENVEFVELLDQANLSVRGVLSSQVEGLRDAAVALKLGRLSIPIDDTRTMVQRVKKTNQRSSHSRHGSKSSQTSPSSPSPSSPGIITEEEELEISESLEASRGFITSILRGIHEIQFAIGILTLSKQFSSVQSEGVPILVTMSMKEVGLDLMRLDPKSPAHLTYFAPNDIAHQALITAISISAGIDDGHDSPDRLIYIPLATATIKTTLPSKLIQLSTDKDATQKNSNIMFANLVVTSPSVDLDPRHLPLAFAILERVRNRASGNRMSPPRRGGSHRFLTRFLPKANIKLSVHEPVVRVSLPCMEVERRGTGDFDLLISAISSMSIDVESSHDAANEDEFGSPDVRPGYGRESTYTLTAGYRVNSHQLYYQTASGEKNNVLVTDIFEVKVQVAAAPHFAVAATGNFQTFNLYMVRPEISEGVRQIVVQLHRENVSRRAGVRPEPDAPKKGSFLRSLPSWLKHVQLQGTDFNFEVAGIDSSVSDSPKGASIHLGSWTTEYKADRHDRPHSSSSPKHNRRRTISRSLHSDDLYLKSSGSPRGGRAPPQSSTDGRRLAIHTHELEAYVIEGADQWESEPFLQLPRFETAVTTSTDQQGPTTHVNSLAKYVYMHYSLYRHFAVGIAGSVLRKTFVRPRPAIFDSSMEGDGLQPGQSPHMHMRSKSEEFRPTTPTSQPGGSSSLSMTNYSREEITTFDIRSSLIQIKATMPAEPDIMVQLFAVDAGRHRWSAPFAHAKLARMYAATPQVQRAWHRIISARNLRVDYRSSKRKTGGTSALGISLQGGAQTQQQFYEERSIDIVSDAIRIGIAHELVVHKIFDSLTNVIKTVEQLHHRFKTGTTEYLEKKNPGRPRRVPKVSLRSHAFLFEIEDSSFEWKLGLIYVQGLQEQRQRLAREEAFRMKTKRVAEGASSQYVGKETKAGGEQAQRERRLFRGRGRHKRKSSEDVPTLKKRSKSVGDDSAPSRSSAPTAGKSQGGSPERPTSRRLRYDAEGSVQLSSTSTRTLQDAEMLLHKFNATSWKRRIDRACKFQQERMKGIRKALWGEDEIPDGIEQRERVMGVPSRPSLMSVMIHGLDITLDKPSFPINEYTKFVNRLGKGIPEDMQYSLLIPLHIIIKMGDGRATLRDYPIPLVHIPPIRSSQSARLAALTLSTDFVIGEEQRDHESMRTVKVEVVPEQPPDTSEPGRGRTKGLEIEVRRTVGSMKMYSDIDAEINTASPSVFTWGASYQPAIQDMMQVIENFMKPPIDPSQRVGFWDKIRLSFHSRIHVAWKSGGDVHLVLKGSRDPYNVTGSGAGFVMCWRQDVRWGIRETDDPKKFMTVDSGEYILAIPDFGHYARRALDNFKGESSELPHSGAQSEHAGKFKKTVMKLSGKVRWMTGIVFERNMPDGGRSFDFIPHYHVVLKNPKYTKAKDGLEYDAFRGFRSHHIHLSIAIAAPVDRDWTVTNLKPSSNYNSVHLSPKFFSHFFKWWSLFSGNMSLPIRQGKLWPGIDKASKKFGRHLATIKYNLLLSPLYLCHMYKYKGPDEHGDNTIYAVGMKVKLDAFMLDLHQRREVFKKPIGQDGAGTGAGTNRTTETTGVRINKAQLDFIAADFRAVSATIRETTVADLDDASDAKLATYSDNVPKANLANFIIPDQDTGWVDMDDFVELDWILPMESTPETSILPLAFAPRFTYFRQTDHHNVISGDPNRTSAFGNEDTHYCVMSARNDPRRVQCDIIQARLDKLAEQLSRQKHKIGENELHVIRDLGAANSKEATEKLEELRRNHELLLTKQEFLQEMHKGLLRRLEDHHQSHHTGPHTNGDSPSDDEEAAAMDDEFYEARDGVSEDESDLAAQDGLMLGRTLTTGGLANVQQFGDESVSDFNNRFIVHNAQLKWSNSLRDIVLRYIHQVSQRRGFVYYMSRPAVKFILDIVEEQQKVKAGSMYKSTTDGRTTEATTPHSSKMGVDIAEKEIQERIQQLLDDGKHFVEAYDDDEPPLTEEPEDMEGNKRKGKGKKPRRPSNTEEDLAREFTAQNAYHVRLIAPQIQLQSEKNTKSAVLVTAKGMQLKVVQIMDKDRVTDDVSGLVQRRFNAVMDSLQVFVSNSVTFKHSPDLLDLYSANRYGAPAGSAWPPWVPLEDMFDFQVDPYGFARVVQRTSLAMDYNKYNTLRLKYNDEVDQGIDTDGDIDETRMDHLWVNFPELLTKCDSDQYYALYVIGLDLLLYNEPQEKTREEKLEKIMLASDFSDLSPAPDMVFRLQEKIRVLQELKLIFQLHEKTLSRQQWKEIIRLEDDISKKEEELFFMMKAITTSQARRMEDRAQMVTEDESVVGTLKWEIKANNLVWHMVRGVNESLIELQLKDVQYHRQDNTDGSNDNTIEVGKIEGWTLLKDATYPQLISAFDDTTVGSGKDGKAMSSKAPSLAPGLQPMVRVHWYMLEAVAGIVVMKRFEVAVVPLKIQLEYDTGQKVFEYIFPGFQKDQKESPYLVKQMLPTHPEEEEEAAEGQDVIPTLTIEPPVDASHDSLTGTGDLALRLVPTLNLKDVPIGPKKPRTPQRSSTDVKRGFRHAEDLRKLVGRSSKKAASASASSDNIPVRVAPTRTNSTISEVVKKDSDGPNKRFTLLRTNTGDTTSTTVSKSKKPARSNDVTQMMDRASKYMTLTSVTVASVALCLSYKGQSGRNLVPEVHDLVFRLPMLDYRNKTWSNLDMFQHLKKEVMKALFSHTGAILGNLISHRGPSKTVQNRLREIAHESIILGNGRSTSGADSPSIMSTPSSVRNLMIGESTPNTRPSSILIDRPRTSRSEDFMDYSQPESNDRSSYADSDNSGSRLNTPANGAAKNVFSQSTGSRPLGTSVLKKAAQSGSFLHRQGSTTSGAQTQRRRPVSAHSSVSGTSFVTPSPNSPPNSSLSRQQLEQESTRHDSSVGELTPESSNSAQHGKISRSVSLRNRIMGLGTRRRRNTGGSAMGHDGREATPEVVEDEEEEFEEHNGEVESEDDVEADKKEK
jgi:hypothetical protein